MPLVFQDTPESSAIARIGYDPITSELRIVFRDKPQYPEYIWGGVDSDLATSFMLIARSKGEFYHSNIKGRSRFRVRRAVGSFRLGALGRRVGNFVRFLRR